MTGGRGCNRRSPRFRETLPSRKPGSILAPVRTPMKTLQPMPLFLAIWACGTIGVLAGNLVAHWAFGGSFPIVSMLGISLAIAAGGTLGTIRRRRRNTRPGQ